MLNEIQYTLDWKPWQQMTKTLNSRNNVALLTWHQGALFTKMSDNEEDKRLQRPHCGQPATILHQRDDHGINLKFWTQGPLQLPRCEIPRYEIPTGGAAVQAWGSCALQDEFKVSSAAVFTIGIAATSN